MHIGFNMQEHILYTFWSDFHGDFLTLFSIFFSIFIFFKIDQIMLGEMKGDNEVGIYSAAVRISELWYLINNNIVY